MASRGAFFSRDPPEGGVWGRVREKAAMTRETIPATQKIEVSAASRAGPSAPRRRKTKGQLAAIQPMVPHSRTRPNSLGSLMWWNEIEFVMRERRHVDELVHQHEQEEGPEGLLEGRGRACAAPPTRCETARKRSLAK